MAFMDRQDRRAPGSRPLSNGALRCEQCGTTWSAQIASHVAWLARTCRRCGGQLHTERRTRAAMRVA